MAKLWQKPTINPDLKSYTRYFGRGLLILAAILVLAGLVLGTFFYGDRQRQSSQTQNQATSEPSAEVAVSNQETPETTSPGTSQPPAASEDSASESANLPSGGPTQVPVTGPEDWILPACLALAVMFYAYRRSGKQLALARENI